MDGIPKLLLHVADSSVVALFVEVASFYGGPLNLLWPPPGGGGGGRGAEEKKANSAATKRLRDRLPCVVS